MVQNLYPYTRIHSQNGTLASIEELHTYDSIEHYARDRGTCFSKYSLRIEGEIWRDPCAFIGDEVLVGLPPQKDIYNEQSKRDADSNDLNYLFPPWSVIFAPIGIAVLGWGWWNIRDNRWRSSITFLIGCILWMYGFAAILMRISMF